MHTPLEPARHDPTAARAIAAAERDMRPGIPCPPDSTLRVRYISTAPLASVSVVEPPTTLAETIARRNELGAVVHLIDTELQTVTGERRRALIDRKIHVERALTHLKGVERELRATGATLPVATSTKRTRARDTVMAAGNAEIVYRLYLMFHHYTSDKAREELTEEHRTFLVGVKHMLKDAEYETYQAHAGDPLDGFFAEVTEVA